MKRSYNTLIILFLSIQCLNAQSPGGFGTINMNLWVKADAGTSSTTNGASLTSWIDQSGSGNDGTQSVGTKQPTYQTVSTNYNPGIDIVGASNPRQHFKLPNATVPGGASSYTVLYVANNVTGTGFVLAAGLDENLRANRFKIGANGELKNSWQNTAARLIIAANANRAGKRTLSCTNYLSGSGRNGFVQALNAASNTATGINTSTANNKIGIREDGIGNLVGDVNEILVYTYSLSALNQAKAETYLAVKYGVTLDNTGGGTQGDYTASNSNNIWDASDGTAYQNGIIGIGRDDASGFVQKQSHTHDDTTRIYLGTLSTSNTLNATTFPNSHSWVLMGDNQGAMNANVTANAEMPAGLTGCALYSRLEREWKVTRTSTNEDFSWDVTLNNPASNPTLVNTAHLRLLVDDDGDFSNGGTTCYYNGDGTGIVITYSNPVITISGISTAHITNNSTRYITIASINSATPLPVKLTQFDIDCKKETPQLTWTTTSEINNDYFTIERSTDAINFKAIGTVNGNGNNNTTINYSWADDNPINGTVYYRLKQTDFNGLFEYNGVRTITCEQSADINIYPNPFENSFTVQISESTTYPVTIEVLDCLGRNVHAQTIESGATEITLNDQLPTGTYFVKVISETTQVVERMMKMK